jgi:GT2 family glycosyltransferase
VIVVSYNTRQMTLDCLRRIRDDLCGVRAEVFLVDNASTDGTPAAVRESFPDVTLIANDRNVGFGAANNQAMRRAGGEFIMLLNSDAFPAPGATRELLGYLRRYPEAGVVGPKLLNADGTTQQSCYRFPSPAQCWRENFWISTAFRHHHRWGDYRHWPHDRERRVEWVVGACLVLRAVVFRQVGGFDERFFMYAEESDWQRRIRDAGWQIAFTPAARVTHLGGASGAADPARINRHFFESLDYYQVKHHGIPGLLALRGAMVVGCAVRGALWALAFLARPARRDLARRKLRLHAWLVWRQLTRWRLIRQAGEGA